MNNNYQLLEYPEVVALSNTEKLIIFLHGYGSDGNDLIELVPFMQKSLPTAHFISLHGIEPFEGGAYGRQWFSLQNRKLEVMQHMCDKAILPLAQMITEKQKQLSLTNKDTIIIGFSQGTMLGLYFTLMQKERLGAMIGFSGRLIPPLANEVINKKTPICFIHGMNDMVVEITEMKEAENYLNEQNMTCETLSIENLAHSIDLRGIEYAIEFIGKYCHSN